MKFDQKKYINRYNKENYKMYQFRIKRDDKLVSFLDNIDNRNNYIVSVIEKDINNDVLTLSKIKKTIKPILNKYGITDINLFGSYARGEANTNSDVDIYCNKGNIKNLIEQGKMEDELEQALNKEVDVIFNSSKMDPFFKEQIMEDMIKLC
mgnify:CR=1 FL=1